MRCRCIILTTEMFPPLRETGQCHLSSKCSAETAIRVLHQRRVSAAWAATSVALQWRSTSRIMSDNRREEEM